MNDKMRPIASYEPVMQIAMHDASLVRLRPPIILETDECLRGSRANNEVPYKGLRLDAHVNLPQASDCYVVRRRM